MRSLIYFFTLFAVFVVRIFAEEEEMMSIDSGQAVYKDKEILLTEGVVVEHEFGKITSDQMVLTPSLDDKRMRFGMLKMTGNVKIALKDGGLLSCALADLNYQNLTGLFFGNNENEYVIYSESCRDKSNNRIPVIVKSKEMSLRIVREELKKSGNSPRSYVSQINADHQVTVDYNHDFIAVSDHAMYHRMPLDPSASKGTNMPGLISLRADTADGTCKVTNRNGDLITANQICIDTIKRHLSFAYPKGALYTVRQGKPSERVDFSADTLSWDDSINILTLHDHVVISQKGLGKITSDGQVKVHQKIIEGKKQLQSIETEGPTVIVHSDEDSTLSHELTCYGKVVVDHADLVIKMESPRDEEGKTPQNQQVYFEDPMGQIYADTLTFKYEYVNKIIVPKLLVLEGHVQILNRYASKDDKEGIFSQYAIADRAEYFPLTKEMMFTSMPDKRVLLYDKVNNLQVSAPALKIKRDEATNKDSVKGIGDVRFSFIEHEFEELKKRFSWGKDE